MMSDELLVIGNARYLLFGALLLDLVGCYVVDMTFIRIGRIDVNILSSSILVLF